MSNHDSAKIVHHISWEMSVTPIPKKRSWLSRISGFVPTKAHVYTMSCTIPCMADDSLDAQMDSLLMQVRSIAASKNGLIRTSAGIEMTRLVHEEILEG